jgi:hypothetical protein
MKVDRKFIFWFNKNKSKEEYQKVFDLFFHDEKRCRMCRNPVYYYDSAFLLSETGKLKLHKKSCLTSKDLDRKYFLSVCEDCLCEKYPEYNLKNKSRVFNHMNYITEYAFNIPREVSLEWAKKSYAITEENLIKKYGEVIGKKRWGDYCNKQSVKNTFEYKKNKYGWTREKFDEYNKSRSVTLENLINRHGEDVGLQIWKGYCDKQKYTTSIEYFISKYGLDKGTDKYDSFCKKRLFGAGYSEVSKKLFEVLKIRLNSSYTTYFADNEWFFYDKERKSYYLIDFFIKELNIGIEFQGDIWHANPNKYKSTDRPFPFQSDYTAEFIWNKDKIKNDFLITKLKKLIIIWESDLYKDGIDLTCDKIIKEIYE